jgi:hypothetical protein
MSAKTSALWISLLGIALLAGLSVTPERKPWPKLTL